MASAVRCNRYDAGRLRQPAPSGQRRPPLRRKDRPEAVEIKRVGKPIAMGTNRAQYAYISGIRRPILSPGRWSPRQLKPRARSCFCFPAGKRCIDVTDQLLVDLLDRLRMQRVLALGERVKLFALRKRLTAWAAFLVKSHTIIPETPSFKLGFNARLPLRGRHRFNRNDAYRFHRNRPKTLLGFASLKTSH